MSQYIGNVSAYAYAQTQGYEGTEEEFAELMASYAEVAIQAAESARQAAQSATTAGQAASSASGSASTANTKAGEAASSAQTASTKASEAAGSAESAARSATTASNASETATTKASEASQSASNAAGSATTATTAKNDAVTAKDSAVEAKEAAETAKTEAEQAAEQAEQTLSSYAKVNGYYQDMTVGDAEQLVSTISTEDKVPYKFRTSGGSIDIGNRENDTIVGGTIAWNQQVKNGNFASDSNWANESGTTHTVENGIVTINSTVNNNGIRQNGVSCIKDHKYLISYEAKHDTPVRIGVGLTSASGLNIDPTVSNTWARYASIRNCTTTLESNAFYIFGRNATLTGAQVRNVQLIDLTKMFGSAVADMIYSMEQSTAGAGVAWVKKLFPNDYYEYNAGELKSVEGLQSHDMVGFNQWDEEWENGYYSRQNGQKAGADTTYFRSKNFIPCFPNTDYYVKLPSVHASNTTYFAILFYDAAKNYLNAIQPSYGTTVFRTPSNCHFMTFYCEVGTSGATYQNDICFNLSWSGTHNGEYEAYEKHSYPLDSSLTLRGIPKLDANNQLYYDGDTYESDGTVTRKYMTFTVTGDDIAGGQNEEGSTALWRTTLATNKFGTNNGYKYGISNQYPVLRSYNNIFRATYGVAFSGTYGTTMLIADSTITSIADLKTRLNANPLVVVYELATPTEETAEPYTNPQIVNDWGTEEYVTDNIVPVGHETKYGANLRDKLQHLPDLASADGYYVIQQTASQMSLVHFRIPQAPTTDGTYVLKATVSGGTPTYVWEEVTE